MTEVIAGVQSVHLVNVEQRQAAADPQTKPIPWLLHVYKIREKRSKLLSAVPKQSEVERQFRHRAAALVSRRLYYACAAVRKAFAAVVRASNNLT